MSTRTQSVGLQPPYASQDLPRAARVVRGGVVGLLTALFALGVAELVAALADDRSSPVIAVGGATIDATPEWLTSFAITTFGANDKVALILGIVVVLVILAVAMGIASVRRPAAGYVGLAMFAAVGALAAATRPEAGPLSVIPSFVGALAGAYALSLLVRAAHAPARQAVSLARGGFPVESPILFDRRRFLLTSVMVAAGGVAAGTAGRVLTARRFGVAEASRDALRIPQPADRALPRPAGASMDVPGITPFVTSNADFYRVDTSLIVPRIAPQDWRLRVHGMVDREIELTLDDLLARPLIERDITLTCVSNEVGGTLAGNARWIGAPLKDLLIEAGVRPGADQLVSRSVDGFTVGTPTAVAMDGRDALLAVSMNGEALPFAHGYPVRMIVPGLYGYVSATKWLTDLELTTFDAFDPYWVQRGWSQEAPIKTMSRIDTPRPLAQVGAETVTVAGVAWAQHRGIGRVEVRVDEGPWRPARLATQDTIDTWLQWSLPWEASPGRHTLQVRATDGDGITQPEERVTPFPNGATGWHSVVVTVS